MAEIIQWRRGSAALWTATNPVLADGEWGLEKDTKKGKFGDGVTAWNSLTYTLLPAEVAVQITAAGAKTTPVDADYFGIIDSVAGNVLKKLSWASIKAMFNALYASATHTHSAADINSGTLATGRGGTGLTGFTASNYLRALNATTLENRTPAQVLADIGAQAAGSYAAASHVHAASQVTAGNFGSGDFVFPANLDINGQVASPTHAKGNITGATTVNFNDGNIQTMTLTGNVTFTFSNPKSGASYQLIISQDATGGRTITWPTMHWGGKTVPTLTGTLNSKDIITITYDGATYNATILKNVGI
jgi:hypothetical protein